MHKEITIGDKYGPAMEITDQAGAKAYFEKCVAHTMSFGTDRAEAERIERANLGYYAGYYSDETRRRVESLFLCAHPIFGSSDQSRRSERRLQKRRCKWDSTAGEMLDKAPAP